MKFDWFCIIPEEASSNSIPNLLMNQQPRPTVWWWFTCLLFLCLQSSWSLLSLQHLPGLKEGTCLHGSYDGFSVHIRILPNQRVTPASHGPWCCELMGTDSFSPTSLFSLLQRTSSFWNRVCVPRHRHPSLFSNPSVDKTGNKGGETYSQENPILGRTRGVSFWVLECSNRGHVWARMHTHTHTHQALFPEDVSTESEVRNSDLYLALICLFAETPGLD